MDSDIYACGRCGELDVKLWRAYQTFRVELRCLNCLVPLVNLDLDQVQEDGSIAGEAAGSLHDRTWALDWWVPAVESSENPGAYWGYTSIPTDPERPHHQDWLNWLSLPLRVGARA